MGVYYVPHPETRDGVRLCGVGEKGEMRQEANVSVSSSAQVWCWGKASGEKL